MTNHRYVVTTVITTAASKAANVVLLAAIHDKRGRNRFARRSQFVTVEFSVQGSIVKLGFVGFLHQELWRMHAVVHHRRSSVDLEASWCGRDKHQNLSIWEKGTYDI